MAGNYPDAPGTKFAYDADGSVGFYMQPTTPVALSGANLLALNGESNASAVVQYSPATGTQYMGIIFPQLRTVTGYWVNAWTDQGGGVSNLGFQYSANTTNGADGTWTSAESFQIGTNGGATTYARDTPVAPGITWRTTVRTLGSPITGCKAIRLGLSSASNKFQGWNGLHLYGTITAATDRLTLWHPTLDQELSGAGLDFGDIIRSTTTDKTFRVKNTSATLTANSILLAMSALTDTTPTYVGQYTISQGGAYAATQTITSLAAGAISAVCTLRLIATSSAGLSVWRQRLTATASTWS